MLDNHLLMVCCQSCIACHAKKYFRHVEQVESQQLMSDPAPKEHYQSITVCKSLWLQHTDWVKAYRQGKPCPILVLIENSQDRKEVFDLGASDYIYTPVLESELYTKLTFRIYTNTYTAGPRLNQCEHRLLKKSQQILLSNLHKKITLDELCRQLGTNRNKLSKIYKQYCQCGALTWFMRQRLEMAAKQLLSSRSRVVDIAMNFGFDSQSHFATAFKKRFGLSPSEYRNRYLYCTVDYAADSCTVENYTADTA